MESLFRPSEEEYVRELIEAGRNQVEDRPGLIFTPDEATEINLTARTQFARGVEAEALPYARTLPNLGGFWQDHLNGGRLVVALTILDDEVTANLLSRMPDPSLGLKVVQFGHSYADLAAAEEQVDEVWISTTGLEELPVSVALRVRDNAVSVGVEPSDYESALAHREALQSRLGVPVIVEREQHGVDVTCNSRSSCSPFRAGLVIRRGSASGPTCTSGFLVRKDTWAVKEQFMTAGHCSRADDGSGGFVWGDGHWYHGGSLVGVVKDRSLYEFGDVNGHKIDVMRIAIDAGPSNMSTKIYGAGSAQTLFGPIDPWDGQELCSSLSASNGIYCGVVDKVAVYWRSERGPWRVYGTSMDLEPNYNPIGGDSGSPVYALDDMSQAHPRWAVGIQDHERITGGSDQC